jgi:hypothetical protein
MKALGIAVYAKTVLSSCSRVSRVLALSVGVIYVTLLPGPMWGQTTTPWNLNGSFWTAPSGIYIGIGTATPDGILTLAATAKQKHIVNPSYTRSSFGKIQFRPSRQL